MVKRACGTIFRLSHAAPLIFAWAALPWGEAVEIENLIVRKPMPLQSARFPSGGVSDFRYLPKEKGPKLKVDTAYLRNGDKLSGVVESISDGSLILRSESLPDAAKLPLENVRKLLFTDREQGTTEGEDADALLVNGDSVNISVKRYDGKEVVAATSFSSEVRIQKEHVAGIVFGRRPRVVYEANFDGGDSCGFRSVVGDDWAVKDGRYGALNSEGQRRGAYLLLPQEGHVAYTWTLSKQTGNLFDASFCFFAKRPDPEMPGDAYSVRISGMVVHLYRTIANNSQHVMNYPASGNRSSRTFEVDYDSRRGTIRLKLDGDELIAGQFASPLTRGKYIIVSARPGEGFDSITVRQAADGVPPSLGKEGNKDCLRLANGDRLSGTVIRISEGKVRMETAYSTEPLELQETEVSSLRLGTASRDEAERLPAVLFRNEDRLSGQVVRLEERSLRVRTPYLGEIEMDVNDVASIIFPGEEELLDEAMAGGE